MKLLGPVLLPPLSGVYGAVTRARLALYRHGTFRTIRLSRPVISVGNITTGGTGKTPLVEWICRTLAAENLKICILTRGYGRENAGRRVLVSDGKTVFASAREAGDEPFMLASALIGVAAVISDADRVAAGEGAIKHLGTDCFVLDDGFQHLRLARDLNIVTIDATNPFGGGSLLPYGRLREPLSGLTRADCVVLTRTDQDEEVEALRLEIARLTHGRPIFLSQMKPVGVARIETNELTSRAPLTLMAFCAIGNPRSFFCQLRKDGYELTAEKSFSDHHRYSQEDVDALCLRAKALGAEALITTAKDAVKISSLRFSLPCYVLRTEISIREEEKFKGLLIEAALHKLRAP